MLDVDKLIEMYKDHYSIPYLSDYFQIDRRKIKCILERSGARIRRSKKSKGRAYSIRVDKERQERIQEAAKIERPGSGYYLNGERVNKKQEWIFITIGRGATSSTELYNTDDCPYSSVSSLGNALRKLKDSGLIDYEDTVSGSRIRNISITQNGKSRVYEPTLKEKIISIHNNYPHLDYVDIAEILGCNRSYPHRILSNL